jgi:hypothetical protein
MPLLPIAFSLSQLLPSHGTIDVPIPRRNGASNTDLNALDEIVVVGRRQNLLGATISASQGTVGADQIKQRPLQRVGDLVEFVPGMVATQHSGSGKANQYFLRGFNLDHATDFATFVEDMPVNLRTHGHGQGYSDLNFVIPEMVGEVRYSKGPYSADVGDFSAAGSAQFRLASRPTEQTIAATLGTFDYARGVATGGVEAAGNTLSYGVELQSYDGPWRTIQENVAKKNAALKVTRDVGAGRARFLVMAYDNRWNSADQIPERAVTSRLINEFGSIDPTLGGNSSRYSVSGGFTAPLRGGIFDVSAYAIKYDFQLFSNFTYFLNDPVNGDQFSQFDDRHIYGGEFSQNWTGADWKVRMGGDARADLIDRVGLSRTRSRALVAPVRSDAVREGSLGLFVDGEMRFNEQWRAYLGTRTDRYRFNVTSLDCGAIIEPSAAAACAANGGKRQALVNSPKASLIYTAAEPVEFYASYGKGFHSNDARGTSSVIDPSSGESITPVTPIVNAFGSELGARLFLSDQLNATLALWQLTIDSELLFVGDAGSTEASRPSRRKGAELGLYYFSDARWTAELEASYTKSSFRKANDRAIDAAGNRIPGAIPLIISAGVHLELGEGLAATARVRHFGGYPLIEDNSARSAGSTTVNANLTKSWQTGSWQNWRASVDVFNLLASKDHDIDYFYASRLAGEAGTGVEDVHFHILEPRSVRFTLAYAF